MANPDTPFGLRPVRSMQGNPYNGAMKKYVIPSTYATNVFLGDAVTITGDSNANEVITGAGRYAPRTLSEVNRSTVGSGNAITGVVVGFDPDPDRLGNVYGAASTTRVVHVCDDPYMLFEIQANGSLAADDVGMNAVLVEDQAGSTVTGLSGVELSTTTVPATTAAYQLSIYALVNRPDNDATLTNVKALVRINNHTNVPGAAGVA